MPLGGLLPVTLRIFIALVGGYSKISIGLSALSCPKLGVLTEVAYEGDLVNHLISQSILWLCLYLDARS